MSQPSVFVDEGILDLNYVPPSLIHREDELRLLTGLFRFVLAAPYEEATRLCLVCVTEAEGDHREAERILREEVCNRSDDGGAPTELSERTQAIIRNHEWLAS